MSDSSNTPYRKPNLEFYRKKAKRLIKLHRQRDPRTLSLIKYNHKRFQSLSFGEIADRKISLRDAQTVVARVDGYAGWPQLKTHVEELQSPTRPGAFQFEQAAEAIANGRLRELQTLLKQNPQLVHARSQRQHRCTLLHYVAANGIEHSRQKTPHNAVQIARTLLEAGAKPDATAGTYGGGDAQTTLSLLVSSGWPYQAGLQGELAKVLCQYGANPDGIASSGLPLATSLVFFYGETAQALAECGANKQHLLAAMAVGTPHDVDQCFTASGRLRSSNFVYIGFQLRKPKSRSEMFGQAFAYAALCGNLPTMKHLAGQYHCQVDGTADRGIRAMHLAAYRGHQSTVRWLLKQGADPRVRDHQWHSTPAAWAHQLGHQKTRRMILNSMQLSIHESVAYFEIDDLKRWLKQDPSLAKQPNSDGIYPIHCLHDDTERGAEIIDLLVNCGASVNQTDPDGRTPIDRLTLQGRLDLVQHLQNHGAISSRVTPEK